MALTFTKATKTQAKLRLALLGPAGSGKTYSALAIARALVGPAGRIAVLDTEHGSASKYADVFDFDTIAPDDFGVETYVGAIKAAEAAGYDALIVDSLSHAWAGKGGILEFVDNYAKRNSGNSFGAWRDATPKHNDLVEAMLASKLHLLVTMRVKMEHVQEKDERGKTVIRKVGLQPVQRDGLEYEFDVVADITTDHEAAISKTRCSAIADKVFAKPAENLAAPLRTWLQGEERPAPSASTAPAGDVQPTTASAHPNGKAESNGKLDADRRRAGFAKLETLAARVVAYVSLPQPAANCSDKELIGAVKLAEMWAETWLPAATEAMRLGLPVEAPAAQATIGEVQIAADALQRKIVKAATKSDVPF